MIGIASYIPDAYPHKAQRRAFVRTQLEWLRRDFPDEDLIVVAQGDHGNALQPVRSDSVLSFDAGIGESEAKNMVLDAFERSGDDWLLMLDNDVIGDKTGKLPGIISALNDTGGWGAVSLVQHDFPAPEDRITFDPMYFLCGAALLIRRACAGHRFEEGRKYMKDVVWGLELQDAGIPTYRIRRGDILQNAGAGSSMLFDSDTERWTVYEDELQAAAERLGRPVEAYGNFVDAGPIEIDLKAL